MICLNCQSEMESVGWIIHWCPMCGSYIARTNENFGGIKTNVLREPAYHQYFKALQKIVEDFPTETEKYTKSCIEALKSPK